MNRGIFVQRGVPDSLELEETARGICQKTIGFPGMEKLIHELAGAYLTVFQKATETKREFFGLRDFYCLMKMINMFCDDSKGLPTFHQLTFALTRNFSGLDTFNPVEIFSNETNSSVPMKKEPQEDDPDVSFKGLINACLTDTNSRHLLLIVENYSALSTFQQQFLERKTHLQQKTIFGSSFRRDQEYTQVIIEAKKVLLWCATPDAIVRLYYTNLADKDFIYETYWAEQSHESIAQYLNIQIGSEKGKRLLAQVTTRAKLLASVHREALSKACEIPESQILILESLTTFDTELQFISKIRDFLQKTKDTPVLLVIQCDTGDENANLIACARHGAFDECSKMQAEKSRQSPVHIVVIVQVTTFSQRDFKSIQCGEWHSVHIDHLYSVSCVMPVEPEMLGKSIARLIVEATRGLATDNDVETTLDKEITDADKTLIIAAIIPRCTLQDKIKCVDLKQILPMCVQRAMSMVKDTGAGGIGITNRISLILSCLQQTHDFVIGIGHLLGLLLLEKERSSYNSRVNNWLPLEAAAVDTIQRTGTLRRACLHIFENKLSPVLAGIVAVLDTNKNINILHERNTWQYNLWMRMLKRTDIFDLTYQDVVREWRSNEQLDFFINGTGFEGHIFQSKMPFSWLILRKINEIQNCNYSFLEEINPPNEAFADIPILKDLWTVPMENCEEAIDCYINDFVNMMYLAKENDETNVVCDMIKQEAIKINKGVTVGLPLYAALLNVHLAYKILSPKLNYFRELNHVWKECSSEVLCISKLSDTHILIKKQCSDQLIQGIYLLIENLSPADDSSFNVFDNSSERSSWLEKVRRNCHIVQQTFTLYASYTDICSDNKHVLVEARSMWNKVVVMQLFLENVCKTSSEDNITIELCDPLWTQLCEDKVDMKQVDTFEKIEEFLIVCFDLAKEEYEAIIRRCYCSKILSDTSKKLPCDHEVCDRCIQSNISDTGEVVCPTCKRTCKGSHLNDPDCRFISGKDKLEDYKRRCTTFLMDIVSQLCFAENQAPGREVIDKLMSYSLESGVKSIGINQDHAFQTFIFKLLLGTSDKEFRHHLEKCLTSVLKQPSQQNDCEDNAGNEDQFEMRERDELLIIIAYCIEDYINEHRKQQVPLKKVQELMFKSDSLVDQFDGIAYARLFLNKAAVYINRQISGRSSSTDEALTILNNEETTFLKTVEIFLEENDKEEARKYLIRYLYRTFGFDILRAVFESKDVSVNWIYTDEFKSMEPERVDRYVACGDMYVSIKDFFKIPIGKKHAEEVIEFVMKSSLTAEHGFIYLQMTMYWEIVVSKYKRYADTMRRILVSLKDTTKYTCNMSLIKALCNDDLKQFNLEIQPETPEKDINIKCIVFQWVCILLNASKQSSCKLFKVLINFATKPSDFKKAFLPTMEQDDIHEIIELLKEGQIDNQVVYRCENGHPYVIRNCGRPWVVSKCPCGATIGGEKHVAEKGNVKDDGKDKTLTGHILGLATERKNGPAPERDLKPLNCACVRLLLHLTMYAACTGENLKDVTEMIKTDIDTSQTVDFLLSHIHKDVIDIQSALQMSPDDALLFCHFMLDSIFIRSENTNINVEIQCQFWSNKEERQQWEKEFDDKYVRPIVQDCSEIVKHSIKLLEGNSDIVNMLTESSAGSDDEGIQYLCQKPMFWMYRVPISFTHMKHSFQRMSSSDPTYTQLHLLKLFFKEEQVLQAVRYIPSMFRLQRILLRKYSRRFYKSDLKAITIATLRQEKVAGEETERLLNDVIEAWESTRHALAERKHVCLSEYGRVFIPKELCDIPFTDETHIEVLLPNTDDTGICSFAMLEILMKTQNDFLDEYCRMSEKKGVVVQMSKVCPREITSAHLISFHPLQDIQPLVLANCSFNVHDSNVEYAFDNFEKQLINRFISTKSIIKMTPFMQIDEMIYRADMSVSDYMKMLDKKIQQVPLKPAMKNQICSDVRDIPDICQVLSHLDITINVLSVTGGEPETMLHSYMVDKLKMNRGVLTTKTRELCKLKHVQSLWMTLSIKKAVIMLNHGKTTKDIFDTIPDPNHETIPEERVVQLKAFLARQSNERLYALQDVLFEYITFEVSRKQNEDDENYQDQSEYPIKHCIYQYASRIEREEELEYVIYEDKGHGFPDEILRKHCLLTWAFVAKHITKCKTV